MYHCKIYLCLLTGYIFLLLRYSCPIKYIRVTFCLRKMNKNISVLQKVNTTIGYCVKYTTIVPTAQMVSGINKMAAEEDDLEAFFLHSIPSLFPQAQRNLQSDNLNVLEYFERRLDDYSYVLRSVRSVILQC